MNCKTRVAPILNKPTTDHLLNSNNQTLEFEFVETPREYPETKITILQDIEKTKELDHHPINEALKSYNRVVKEVFRSRERCD